MLLPLPIAKLLCCHLNALHVSHQQLSAPIPLLAKGIPTHSQHLLAYSKVQFWHSLVILLAYHRCNGRVGSSLAA
ncbi:hypothetical protein BD309DRAFT_969185 [Dichomitus squalens]|uniref:Uncharacterized protein n=1 Tax=Dichomitus squalens TaxID=114155 RepID=A0A4Q9N475_9APHY|nr:hypothetical protein BD311DRAFT_743842 [Dichomitus squalens]TBU39655.1 hypothetical protein BD309DRAFT_969185 [Dichomitus squalens]TBU53423.1 hypothetical protein BD310DRAFT_938161 [Dichomitus squalens]